MKNLKNPKRNLKKNNLIPVTLRISKNVLDDIERRAGEADRDRSKQINHMIKWYINENPIEKGRAK